MRGAEAGRVPLARVGGAAWHALPISAVLAGVAAVLQALLFVILGPIPVAALMLSVIVSLAMAAVCAGTVRAELRDEKTSVTGALAALPRTLGRALAALGVPCAAALCALAAVTAYARTASAWWLVPLGLSLVCTTLGLLAATVLAPRAVEGTRFALPAVAPALRTVARRPAPAVAIVLVTIALTWVGATHLTGLLPLIGPLVAPLWVMADAVSAAAPRPHPVLEKEPA